MSSIPSFPQRGSVSWDWRAPLSPEKSQTFAHTISRLETAYCVFSVNLDEALGTHRTGRMGKANQLLSVSPALCNRLIVPLLGLLRAMHLHTRHFGTTPNLTPLDPSNFQNSKSQRAAFFSGLFSKVLLARGTQFLHKVSSLAGMVEDLAKSFDSAVEELNDCDSAYPDENWELLDAAHYDLNTCLRESVVLLKSFLHALPEEQIVEFRLALHMQSTRLPAAVSLRPRHLAHRRMDLIKGQ